MVPIHCTEDPHCTGPQWTIQIDLSIHLLLNALVPKLHDSMQSALEYMYSKDQLRDNCTLQWQSDRINLNRRQLCMNGCYNVTVRHRSSYMYTRHHGLLMILLPGQHIIDTHIQQHTCSFQKRTLFLLHLQQL